MPASRGLAIVAATLLVAVAVVAGALMLRGRSTPPARDGLVPQDGAYFGAWVKPERWSREGQLAAFSELEATLGRPLDIAQQYYPFAEAFPTWREEHHLREGRIPLISWNGTDTGAIAEGRFDTLIVERAQAVAALEEPVMIRWAWEMDTRAKQQWGTPAEYVRAWRRIQRTFDEHGADNAAWVWCPTAYGFTQGRAAQYYPGDEWVDWVCADGYNFAPAKSDWRSFESIFADFYNFGVGRDKPMMVGEFGVMEGVPGKKAGWLKGAATALRERFPRISAAVYFDSRREFDWSVDSSPGALQAFTALANDEHFGGRKG